MGFCPSVCLSWTVFRNYFSLKGKCNMEDFEYCGRNMDLTTLTKDKFLKYKLLGCPKHPNGVFSVFINSTSVVIFRNEAFIQFRVVTKGKDCYLRIDTSKKDLELRYIDWLGNLHKCKPFNEGYVLSYPLDFIGLSSSLYMLDDCSKINYKGIEYVNIDNADFQSDADLMQFSINTEIVPDNEYVRFRDSASIGTIYVDFSKDSFLGVRISNRIGSLSFPFVKEPTVGGSPYSEVSLTHHFNRFRRQVDYKSMLSEQCFIMMQSISNDDIIFLNKNYYVQFSVINFDDKNYLRVVSNCDGLAYSNSFKDEMSQLSRGEYLLSEGTHRKVELSVRNTIGNSERIRMGYMNHVYRMVHSHSIMSSRDWIGRKCVTLHFLDFDVSLTEKFGEFLEVHTVGFKLDLYDESNIRLNVFEDN